MAGMWANEPPPTASWWDPAKYNRAGPTLNLKTRILFPYATIKPKAPWQGYGSGRSGSESDSTPSVKKP